MAQTFALTTGTQAATVNTEHTLGAGAEQSNAGVYTITVNLKNMALGDVLELRAYQKGLTGDAQKFLTVLGQYAHKQGDGVDVGSKASGEVLAVSIPIVAAFGVVFTLLQTAGTGRSFDWRVDQLS